MGPHSLGFLLNKNNIFLQNEVFINIKMSRRNPTKVVVERANVFMEERGDVIYVIDDQQMVHQVEQQQEEHGEDQQVYQILEEVNDDEIYEVVETEGQSYITVPNDAMNEEVCHEYATTVSDDVETIEIISEVNESVDNEEIIYVTTEDVDDNGGGVTFMQVRFLQ